MKHIMREPHEAHRQDNEEDTGPVSNGSLGYIEMSVDFTEFSMYGQSIVIRKTEKAKVNVPNVGAVERSASYGHKRGRSE